MIFFYYYIIFFIVGLLVDENWMMMMLLMLMEQCETCVCDGSLKIIIGKKNKSNLDVELAK